MEPISTGTEVGLSPLMLVFESFPFCWVWGRVPLCCRELYSSRWSWTKSKNLSSLVLMSIKVTSPESVQSATFACFCMCVRRIALCDFSIGLLPWETLAVPCSERVRSAGGCCCSLLVFSFSSYTGIFRKLKAVLARPSWFCWRQICLHFWSGTTPGVSAVALERRGFTGEGIGPALSGFGGSPFSCCSVLCCCSRYSDTMSGKCKLSDFCCLRFSLMRLEASRRERCLGCESSLTSSSFCSLKTSWVTFSRCASVRCLSQRLFFFFSSGTGFSGCGSGSGSSEVSDKVRCLMTSLTTLYSCGRFLFGFQTLCPSPSLINRLLRGVSSRFKFDGRWDVLKFRNSTPPSSSSSSSSSWDSLRLCSIVLSIVRLQWTFALVPGVIGSGQESCDPSSTSPLMGREVGTLGDSVGSSGFFSCSSSPPSPPSAGTHGVGFSIREFFLLTTVK